MKFNYFELIKLSLKMIICKYYMYKYIYLQINHLYIYMYIIILDST
jgi:hypothetical protein